MQQHVIQVDNRKGGDGRILNKKTSTLLDVEPRSNLSIPNCPVQIQSEHSLLLMRHRLPGDVIPPIYQIYIYLLYTTYNQERRRNLYIFICHHECFHVSFPNCHLVASIMQKEKGKKRVCFIRLHVVLTAARAHILLIRHFFGFW